MIKSQNINTKIRVSIRYLTLILFFPIIVLIALLIKLIRPFILIRWSRLDNARIGHFATNVEIYLLKKKFGIDKPNKNYIDFFYKPELKICNKQLEKMWHSKILVMPWFIAYPLEFLRERNILFNKENSFLTHSVDRHNLLDTSEPILSFSLEERKKGFDFLRRVGLPENAKFVCLQVRDNSYLDEEKYNYHKYRNCDVENFKLACNFLANENIFVFRMGRRVSKKISYGNSKIIDYATNGMRTDFLDIFLGSECLFWLSTGSGIDNMSKLFRKPILYTNQSPIGYITTYQKTALVIFKHFFDKKTKSKLNIDELKQKKLCFATNQEQYENNNVIIKENDSIEIEAATREMFLRIKTNFWETWDETKSNQKIFWNKFPYQKNLHGKITSNIGKEFLIKNNNFYN
jgi:putative glycosyltransferase (TIGR04372 family)